MDRKLTTILAADLAGYSRLMAADEEGVIGRLRAVRADVVEPAVAAAGGRVVKTMGDGLLIEFLSPVAAVRAALAVQQAMVARETGLENTRLRFRIGIHLGDVVVDGDDLLGDGVNVAARLETLAPAGGLCISRAVYEQVRGKLEATLTALGPQPVKNLPEPVEVWRVEVAGAAAPAARAPGIRPAVAVLPFDNMSRDPDQDFLADGIVEDVITELSRFRELTVIARNSSFSFRGQAKDLREIARELGVRYVVEGSVRRAGDRLRVTAQLIDAADGSHVWAERWDRTMADLFDLQDELTAAIVAAVAPEIGAHERRLAARKSTEALNAWELLQRAHAEFLRYTPDGVDHAKRLAARAIEADAGLVLGHALLARALATDVMLARAPDVPATRRAAIAAAERAVALDGRSEEAYVALGFALKVAGRRAEGLAAMERARALNPNNATAALHLAAGRLDDAEVRDPAAALAAARDALRLSPADPFVWTFRIIAGLALVELGEHAAARELLDEARSQPNPNWKSPVAAAAAAIAAGEPERARALVAEARALQPDLTLAMVRRGMTALAVAPLAAFAERLVDLGLPDGSD